MDIKKQTLTLNIKITHSDTQTLRHKDRPTHIKEESQAVSLLSETTSNNIRVTWKVRNGQGKQDFLKLARKML